jgi:hypothetical protein
MYGAKLDKWRFLPNWYNIWPLLFSWPAFGVTRNYPKTHDLSMICVYFHILRRFNTFCFGFTKKFCLCFSYYSILSTAWRLTRHVTYMQRNTEARSRTPCCRGKAINIAYSVCVCVCVCVCLSVALFIQHAKRMSRIILSSVTFLAVPYFPHYLMNGTMFGKTLLNIKFVFWFYL